MNSLQQMSNIQEPLRKILGIENWSKLVHTISISDKVTIITDFLIDTYSFIFEKEDEMTDISTELDILTSIDDDEYELTDEIVNSIMKLNQIVDNDDVIDEIKQEIKTLLVYILDILQ